MDDHQDIARSSYADMLHDDERNHAYHVAIKANVNYLVRSTKWNPNGDRFFNCCDIGTGSGLLSMMIVGAFRELNYEHFHVTAFEAFEPMAGCAKKVIAANGISDKITVISGRSEDCTENPQFDLLVAELLDTELIGEGCLSTYRHALQNLCSSKCIFIPKQAHIYMQPLDSEDLWSRNGLRSSMAISQELHISLEDSWTRCPGLAEIDDMQLSQVDKKYSIRKISQPEKIFSFYFDDLDSLRLRDTKLVNFQVEGVPKFLVIAMWWEVVMYDEFLYQKSDEHPFSFSTLSCAPEWHRREQYGERDRYIRQTYGREVWREHWIQGVYYLRDDPWSTALSPGLMAIHAHHDSHSIWFSWRPDDAKHPATCTCGAHRILSRPECAFLGSPDLRNMCLAIHQDRIEKCRQVRLDFNTGEHKIKDLPAFKRNTKYRAIQLTHTPHVYEIDHSLQDEVSYAKVLKDLIDGSHEAYPFIGVDIMCAQVCFTNLNRVRTRVGRCQGFDLTHLDELIEQSSRLIDASTESHHLIEYEFTAPSSESPRRLLSVNNSTRESEHESFKYNFSKCIELNISNSDRNKLKEGMAIIFWPDFYLLGGRLLSGGHDPTLGDLRSESMQPNCRQIVHFLHNHPAIMDKSCDEIKLTINIGLDGIRVTR